MIAGYRLIHTAQAYGNERGVGEGIRTCGLGREQLFVTSKVAAEAKSYEGAARSIDETLSKMRLRVSGYDDHSQSTTLAEFRVQKRDFAENKEVWRALEDAYAAGKLRAIGVSNFLQDDLENMLEDSRIKPMVNQILLHITNTDHTLLDFCQKQGILVEAYSPIAHGEALKILLSLKWLPKYNVTPAQLCIRYVLQLGTVALPKTANPAHMRDNGAVDFQISPEDMQTLEAMEKIESYGEFDMFPVFSGKPLG